MINISIDDKNGYLELIDNLILSENGTHLVFSSDYMKNSIFIPNSVEIIENNMLYESNFENVIFGNSVKEIKERALYANREIESIVLPNSLQIIPRHSFHAKRITNPDGNRAEIRHEL